MVAGGKIMISILYAGVFGLVYVVLSFKVALMRKDNRLAFGDGGNPEMTKLIRAHGNFAEYVPFAILLLCLLDYERRSFWIIHALGMLLVVARTLHFIGLSKDVLKFRMAGMILTMLMITLSSLLLLWHFFAVQVIGF